MSECVVRMEMPQKCFNCDLRYECNAFYAPGKPKPFMKGCMIVCQLPEGHGRLVDADSLPDLFPRYHNGYMTVGIPTVVPAEAERSEEK